MSKNDVKTVTNIENLTVWKRTEGEESTTYGNAVSLVKRLMTVSDNPTTVSDDLYGDGEAVASYSANMGGTLELGLTDLTAADRVLFFGETDENGTNIVSKQMYAIIQWLRIRAVSITASSSLQSTSEYFLRLGRSRNSRSQRAEFLGVQRPSVAHILPTPIQAYSNMFAVMLTRQQTPS